MLGLKLPNMLGRAEKLTFQFSYGTKETSYGLSFFKPQPGFFERKYVASGADVSLSLSLSDRQTPPPLFQPDSQPLQSHRSVPVELPQRDRPGAVGGAQRERACCRGYASSSV